MHIKYTKIRNIDAIFELYKINLKIFYFDSKT